MKYVLVAIFSFLAGFIIAYYAREEWTKVEQYDRQLDYEDRLAAKPVIVGIICDCDGCCILDRKKLEG